MEIQNTFTWEGKIVQRWNHPPRLASPRLASQQYGPGFKSRRLRHTWDELAVGSLLCSERFSSGYYGFFSPQIPTFSHWFQFDQESGKRRTTKWMCYFWIVIYLLILFIHNVINLPVTATVEELTLDINGVIGSFSVATSFCIRESLIMKFVALVSCKHKI